MFIRSVICGALLWCFGSIALAQVETYRECGTLSAGNCALVDMTVQRWNALFGDKLRIVGFVHKGPADNEQLDRLYSRDSSSRALAINESTGLFQVTTIGALLAGATDHESAEATRNKILRFRNSLTEHVQFEWQSDGETFYTDALVGDEYPYLIDTMIASIILAVRPTASTPDAKLCYETSLRFLTYIEVGRFNANFYSTTHTSPIEGTSLNCATKLYGYNSFGAIAFDASEVEYKGDSCSSKVRLAYTSPFASVTISAKMLEVEFSGIGGGWIEEAICTLP